MAFLRIDNNNVKPPKKLGGFLFYKTSLKIFMCVDDFYNVIIYTYSNLFLYDKLKVSDDFIR